MSLLRKLIYNNFKRTNIFIKQCVINIFVVFQLLYMSLLRKLIYNNFKRTNIFINIFVVFQLRDSKICN